ncbi:MAG: EamA family transporter RarD, partial [Rhodoglobus sp.]|nr:EamA family transporter RarD [Rhodoglobus sp.]
MHAPLIHPHERISPTGLLYAVGAYFLWGFLPLLFIAVAASGAIEIVSWRIVLSLVFCAVLLTVTRGWRRLAAIVRDRSAFGALALAAVFILINWSVFIYATLSGHVIEASLGYFTNP